LNILRIDEKVDNWWVSIYLLLILRIGPTLMQVSLQTRQLNKKSINAWLLGRPAPKGPGLPNFRAYTLKAIGGGAGLPGLPSPLQNLSIKT
jgi:hypothetical protein